MSHTIKPRDTTRFMYSVKSEVIYQKAPRPPSLSENAGGLTGPFFFFSFAKLKIGFKGFRFGQVPINKLCFTTIAEVKCL